MEVHHHHKHEQGSGWKESLKEFFMLFLAVLCGFFAEMQVHNSIEHKQEREYIHSIQEDISSDIRQMDRLLADWSRAEKGLDTLIGLLSGEAIKTDSREAYRLWTNYIGFEDFSYDDRTIQQLKNAGGLRLIEEKEVSNQIMRYDQAIRKFQLQVNVMTTEVLSQQYYFRLFDFVQLKKSTNEPVPLTAAGKLLLTEAVGERAFYQLSFRTMLELLKGARLSAQKTLETIQKEYKD